MSKEQLKAKLQEALEKLHEKGPEAKKEALEQFKELEKLLDKWVFEEGRKPEEKRQEAAQIILESFLDQFLSEQYTSIDLEGLGLRSFPDFAHLFPNLEELCLSGNKISCLKNILKFSNLHELNVTGNELTEVPYEIGDCKRLENLHLSQNRIEKISSKIINLSNLCFLDLDRNRLENMDFIPSGEEYEGDVFGKIFRLNLAHNQIRSVPSGIKRIKFFGHENAHEFNLSYNLLQGVIDFAGLDASTEVFLEGNLFSEEEIQVMQSQEGEGLPDLFFSVNEGAREELFEIRDEELEKVAKTISEENAQMQSFLLHSAADDFKRFLVECNRTKSWQEDSKKMVNFLNKLVTKMMKNTIAKEKCELIATTAIGTCGDRVTAAFTEMQIEVAQNPLPQETINKFSVEELFGYYHRKALADFLHKEAQEKISNLSGAIDEIEVHLAYLFKFSEDLHLKASDMLYGDISRVSDEDIKRSREKLAKITKMGVIAKYLYENDEAKKSDYVLSVINKISEQEEFDSNQKEGESGGAYKERVENMQKNFQSAVINKITADMSQICFERKLEQFGFSFLEQRGPFKTFSQIRNFCNILEDAKSNPFDLDLPEEKKDYHQWIKQFLPEGEYFEDLEDVTSFNQFLKEEIGRLRSKKRPTPDSQSSSKQDSSTEPPRKKPKVESGKSVLGQEGEVVRID